MNSRLPILLLAGMAASCGRSDDQTLQPTPASNAAAVELRRSGPAPAPASDVASREEAAGALSDGTGARAAADVLKTYYRLIEAGRYDEAWRLRWESDAGESSGFAAHFAEHAEYHASVGNPSEVQGAAGSSYVEIPVQLYGQMKNGESFGSAGTVTLRRVNDVPGATAAQRRWRIYTSE